MVDPTSPGAVHTELHDRLIQAHVTTRRHIAEANAAGALYSRLARSGMRAVIVWETTHALLGVALAEGMASAAAAAADYMSQQPVDADPFVAAAIAAEASAARKFIYTWQAFLPAEVILAGIR